MRRLNPAMALKINTVVNEANWQEDLVPLIWADSKVKCNTCNPVRSADAKHPKTLPATSA